MAEQQDRGDGCNHAEALELAALKKDESNLARCYLELNARLSPSQPSGVAMTDDEIIEFARKHYLTAYTIHGLHGEYGGRENLISAVRSLIAALQSSPKGATTGTVSVPALESCSKEEVAAFETWAASAKYDMTTHPIHWLFLNERTYAARQGWKAALEFARASLSSPQEASKPQEFRYPQDCCEGGTAKECPGCPRHSQPSAASGRELPPTDVQAELLDEFVNLCFQCARYERPSTDWREAGKKFIAALTSAAPADASIEKELAERLEDLVCAVDNAAPAERLHTLDNVFQMDCKKSTWHTVLEAMAAAEVALGRGHSTQCECKFCNARKHRGNSHRTPADKVDAEIAALREAVIDAADEWSGYVEVDTAPRRCSEHIAREFDAAIDRMRSESGKGGKP